MQNDGVRYVAIINIAEDEAAKDSSPYSLAELQFFNHLVRPCAYWASAGGTLSAHAHVRCCSGRRLWHPRCAAARPSARPHKHERRHMAQTDAGRVAESTLNQMDLRACSLQVQSIAMTEGATPGVCSISSREALNIDIRGATQMTQLTQEQLDNASLKLTVGQKEKALLRLQADMWLGKDDTGNVTLGVRLCAFVWKRAWWARCTPGVQRGGRQRLCYAHSQPREWCECLESMVYHARSACSRGRSWSSRITYSSSTCQRAQRRCGRASCSDLAGRRAHVRCSKLVSGR